MTPALLTRIWSAWPESVNRPANRSMELGSARSSGHTSTLLTPASARSAFPVSRAPTMTCAPAAASTRAVSGPMPDDPPVTTAVLPLRLTPAATSRAVVVGPNPVRRGFCSVSSIVCMGASIVFLLWSEMSERVRPAGAQEFVRGPGQARAAKQKSTRASLHEVAVLRLVNVAADERLAVGRALDAGEEAVEHDLGHSGGHLDLGLQDVRLRREEQPLLQLRRRHLVREGVRGF